MLCATGHHRPADAALSSLNRRGLVIGSSSEVELQGEMPRGYLATIGRLPVRRGSGNGAVEENIGHRRRLTAYYHGALAELGFAPLAFPGAEELPLLRYPVRVANKAEVLERAAQARMENRLLVRGPAPPGNHANGGLRLSAGHVPARREGEPGGVNFRPI